MNGKRSKMTLKKKVIIYSFIIFDFLVIVPIFLFFVFTPRSEISSLKNQYVKINLRKNKSPHYDVVSKKPKDWVNLKDMNSKAVNAIVVSEDWFFYKHGGYDLGQIKEAISNSVTKGKSLRGASTISQQLIKNLYFDHSRSYVRKVKEAVFTLYMEKKVDKKKILETYLNVIQYGDGIYGIKAAAKHYFNKHPKDLTVREGAFLAMLLPNPLKNAQSFRDKELTKYGDKTVNTILKKMVKAKYITPSELKESKNKRFYWEKKNQIPNADLKRLEQLGDLEEESELGKTDDASQLEGVKKKKINGYKNGKEDILGKKKKQDKKVFNAKLIKRKKQTGASGENYENNYKYDKDLELDGRAEFDDDAIIEDNTGMDPEFNVD